MTLTGTVDFLHDLWIECEEARRKLKYLKKKINKELELVNHFLQTIKFYVQFPKFNLHFPLSSFLISRKKFLKNKNKKIFSRSRWIIFLFNNNPSPPLSLQISRTTFSTLQATSVIRSGSRATSFRSYHLKCVPVGSGANYIYRTTRHRPCSK